MNDDHFFVAKIFYDIMSSASPLPIDEQLIRDVLEIFSRMSLG